MFSKGSKPSTTEQTRSGATSSDSEAAKVAAVPSIISADLKITGNLESSGDIQVDGTVQGDITSRTLTIGEAAHVKGSVLAESVRVCGHVSGEIRSTSVTLAKTAKVDGDIAHQSLAIEAGAYIEGNIRRLEADKPTETNVAVINPAAKVQSVSQGASGQNGGGKTEQPSAPAAKAEAGGNPMQS